VNPKKTTRNIRQIENTGTAGLARASNIQGLYGKKENRDSGAVDHADRGKKKIGKNN